MSKPDEGLSGNSIAVITLPKWKVELMTPFMAKKTLSVNEIHWEKIDLKDFNKLIGKHQK